MIKINVYSIEKSQSLHVKQFVDEYIKMSLKYAVIEDKVIFNKQIAKAQVVSEEKAKVAYTNAFLPYLDGFNICLDVGGKVIDSLEFAEILKNESKINFFIGGAYGLEKGFLSKSQKIISLSRLTYAHKIAKIVLYEQIYRGLGICNGHPYHK